MIEEQTKDVLNLIDGVLLPFPDKLYPKPRVHDEDGSVLVEWAFPAFRIGFNIEPDPSESGWFIVAKSTTFSETSTDYPRISRIIMDWLVEHELIIPRKGI